MFYNGATSRVQSDDLNPAVRVLFGGGIPGRSPREPLAAKHFRIIGSEHGPVADQSVLDQLRNNADPTVILQLARFDS